MNNCLFGVMVVLLLGSTFGCSGDNEKSRGSDGFPIADVSIGALSSLDKSLADSSGLDKQANDNGMPADKSMDQFALESSVWDKSFSDILNDIAHADTKAKCIKHADCDDYIKCTTDLCTVAGCTYIVDSNQCLISGKCIIKGTQSLKYNCKFCDPLISQSAWTNIKDGTSCSDGNPCTYSDKCTVGSCTGIPYVPGCVSTIAGSKQGFKDGQGTSAQFNHPKGIALDGKGNIYVADSMNNRIRMIVNGTTTTFAGSGSKGFKDGAAAVAQFKEPTGIAIGSSGEVYIADRGNHRIRVIKNGIVSTFAGTGQKGHKDGISKAAWFAEPIDLELSHKYGLLVVDHVNFRIRGIKSGNVNTLAGSGNKGYINGKALSASFNAPTGIAVSSNIILISEIGNNVIRSFDGTNVSTFAGTGSKGFKNGVAGIAQFNNPWGMVVDSTGVVYLTDVVNKVIRKISSGVVSTFAGSVAGANDGSRQSAKFNNPVDIAFYNGKFYVSDTNNNRIRLITP